MLRIENGLKSFGKSRTATFVAVFAVVASGFFLCAKISSGAKNDFAAAADFPRGALVYAQVKDLPALLRMWDKSELKQKYLASQNFDEFKDRHLALKLAARWQEFNDALGFELSAEAIAGATDRSAAIAIYDVGKMEIVFVAPVSDQKFAATMFFQNQNQFEPTTLDDNTIYYSRRVEADRGRQQQKILFANSHNRFVLATSESLLLRTLANIKRRSRADSLAHAPAFLAVSKRVTANMATVWLDQAKLNQDWHFKHYWIMRNASDLKTMRAGMFDFEMRDRELIERREFWLTAAKTANRAAPLSAKRLARLQAFVVTDAPFFKAQSVANDSPQAASLLQKTVLSIKTAALAPDNARRWNSFDDFQDSNDDDDERDYFVLDSTFDRQIDRDDKVDASENDQTGAAATPRDNGLQQILAAAVVRAAAQIWNVRTPRAALFAEFERAAVFELDAPEKLDRRQLENRLSANSRENLAVQGAEFDLSWSDAGEPENSWRELEFLALERKICYAVRGDFLIVANSADLMRSIVAEKKAESPALFAGSVDEIAVIRLDRRATAFDQPFDKIWAEENPQNRLSANSDAGQSVAPKKNDDFISGNVGSVLDVIGDAKQIEIKRTAASDFLSETIVVTLK